jgi:hypothetical protein
MENEKSAVLVYNNNRRWTYEAETKRIYQEYAQVGFV